MLGRLTSFLTSKRKSKDVARERLRFVLMQDRARLSPELLDELRDEIVRAISKYVDIDRSGMEVELTREGEAMALVASIPVRGLRRSRSGGNAG